MTILNLSEPILSALSQLLHNWIKKARTSIWCPHIAMTPIIGTASYTYLFLTISSYLFH